MRITDLIEFYNPGLIRRNGSQMEAATPGATSTGNIATVVNPGMTNKNPAAGKPGKMAKKGPPQWVPKKQKPTDNALNSLVGLMTGQVIKR